MNKAAALGLSLALALGTSGLVQAAPSLNRPGQDVASQIPQGGKAEVHDETPAKPAGAPEVHFTITNFRLEAPELELDHGDLTKILQDGMGENRTMRDLNATINQLTRYCRQHGYPAAAAYVPAQESSDGMVTLRIIPGRYGAVKIENHSKLKERVAQGFLNGLKADDIIRTGQLETTLYSISDVSGTRAVGVLRPGQKFGTSDLTVRIEEGKGDNTVLYVENYGSKNTGRYRYGLQENLYDIGGTGSRASVGTLLSNDHMHDYYANYEMLIGHGGTSLGVGFSRMDYQVGGELSAMDANGEAYTYSLFGSRPLYHLTRSQMKFIYGYDYRRMTDDIDLFHYSTRKHSNSIHVGLTGSEQRNGFALSYDGTVTMGNAVIDNDYRRRLGIPYTAVEGSYTKAAFDATATQRLGHRTDVMLKASGQLADNDLDGSEEMYLGGANGIRAYPQGTGSGDVGIMGTAEFRYYTDVPGLLLSTYFDYGHVRYSKSHTPDRVYNDQVHGQFSSGMTLAGWGLGLSYTKPDDWFARLDYARRIGSDANLSEDARAHNRVWFLMGKNW